jgi:GNAT superfamily N-acetyltransferase
LSLQLANDLWVRDAQEADLPGMVAIKGAGSELLHRDRLRDARHPGFRYLVLQQDQQVVALACLVFQRPAYWSDGADVRCLPQIVDLQVLEGLRSQGYGSLFIRALEKLAAQAGYSQLFLSVEPLSNPRAHALYLRLGYRPLQSEPYLSSWMFLDSSGQAHRGEDWVVDMRRDLEPV